MAGKIIRKDRIYLGVSLPGFSYYVLLLLVSFLDYRGNGI